MSAPSYHLVSSRDVDREAGVEEQLSDKYVSIPAGSTLQLCDLRGPGRILRIWFTTPVLPGSTVLRDLVCRMYWDGEEHPSVLCPLGDLFGAPFGRPRRFSSAALTIAGGGYLCSFEMPFAEQAVIELSNESKRAIRYLFFQVGYHSDPGIQGPPATFHAHYRQARARAGDPPIPLLQATGSGRFVGTKMDLQAASWWLRPPLHHIAIPRGLGLGLLEGWENVQVDGAEPISGTGLEDFFNGGFYFRGGPFSTHSHGAPLRSFVLGRASAYRLQLGDPIPFQRSLEITADHGYRNQLAGDYATVAFWYQAEPHAPLAELPPARERRPSFPTLQLAQIALLVLLPVALIILAAVAIR